MKVMFCGGGQLAIPDSDCANAKEHTPQPEGYMAWHRWAEKMYKTYRQSRCPVCSKWNIWGRVK